MLFVFNTDSKEKSVAFVPGNHYKKVNIWTLRLTYQVTSLLHTSILGLMREYCKMAEDVCKGERLAYFLICPEHQ
jgi:hypothetical protein